MSATTDHRTNLASVTPDHTRDGDAVGRDRTGVGTLATLLLLAAMVAVTTSVGGGSPVDRNGMPAGMRAGVRTLIEDAPNRLRFAAVVIASAVCDSVRGSSSGWAAGWSAGCDGVDHLDGRPLGTLTSSPFAVHEPFALQTILAGEQVGVRWWTHGGDRSTTLPANAPLGDALLAMPPPMA